MIFLIISIFFKKKSVCWNFLKFLGILLNSKLRSVILQDLLATVEKMNSGLRNKERGNFFHQHELESLELGMCFQQIFLHPLI